MNPTIEQQHAIDMALHGQSCKVTAYAGAGKTSTLKLIGNAKHHQVCHRPDGLEVGGLEINTC